MSAVSKVDPQYTGKNTEKAMLERECTSHEIGFLDVETPTRRQIVSGVVFLGGTLESSLVIERIHHFVSRNPQFRCRIDTRRRQPVWRIDSGFDLNAHFSELQLGECSMDCILSDVSAQASMGLSMERPPWQMTLVNYRDSESHEQKQCLAIWAHHSLLDGLQGMKLFEGLLDGPGNSRRKQPTSPQEAEPNAEQIKAVSAACTRTVAGEMFKRPPSGPFAAGKKHSQRRTAVVVNWPRKSFAEARQISKASFQEVLLQVLADGLVGYARRSGSNAQVRAILPMGRADGKDTSFTTNRHDIGYIALPPAEENTSNLGGVRKNLLALQAEQQQGVFQSILRFLAPLPATLRKSLVRKLTKQADLLISIIPAGGLRGKIGGVPVDSLVALPALPICHSVVIGVVVTRKQIALSIQADPECVERIEDIKQCLQSAFRRATQPDCGSVLNKRVEDAVQLAAIEGGV